MALFGFIYGGGNSPTKLLAAAVVSAAASTAVLAVVNRAAQEIASTGEDFVDLRWGLLFAISVICYMLADSWMVERMAADIEGAIHRQRMRLVRALADADLRKLEELGQAQIYESITRNCEAISQNSQYVALSIRSMVLVSTILAYMAYISVPAFLVVGGCLLAGGRIYLTMSRELDERQRISTSRQGELFEAVNDLFDGFKEQKLNSLYSDNLNRTYQRLSDAELTAAESLQAQSWRQFVFGETAFNLMIGTIIFVVPGYTASFGQDMVKLSAAVIFLSAPVFSLMQSVAVLRGAESASRRMLDLGGLLTTLREGFPLTDAKLSPEGFETLAMDGLQFAFAGRDGEAGFSIGPLDATIHKGEIIFVSGGNGAGKSTFVKLLTGLYQPAAGVRLVNGTPVTSDLIVSYRQLIAPVFADVHLQPDIHTAKPFSDEEAGDLMRWFAMDHVTTLRAGRFGTRELSSGQKKRLALIAALLEHKPILVLDEWAADQDPEFRAKFYKEILPALKAGGLTILAVTHDDHYMHLADRCLHMEEGQLFELSVAGAKA